MNYQRIYASIILRAQCEESERKWNKKNLGAYYEVHHIIPKSLGGTNQQINLAMLTAREHFICHWLLIKMYPDGSDAQTKMLFALWRMRSSGDTQLGKRYVNARAYALLRAKYASVVGNIMSVRQRGKSNSRYGSRWYTNSADGSVICSKKELTYPWVAGRNLFRGEFNYLRFDHDGKSVSRKVTISSAKSSLAMNHRSDNSYKAYRHQTAMDDARKLWNVFHSDDYTSLGDFVKVHGVTYQAIRKRFKNHIPIFNEKCKHGVCFSSDKNLIGVYETDG